MLKKEGKQIYDDLTDYMKNQGTLECVDDFTIEMLSTYVQIFFERQIEVLKPDGAVQVYQNRSSNISGNMVAMNKAMDYIITISQKIGIYDIMKDKLRQYGKITADSKKYLK